MSVKDGIPKALKDLLEAAGAAGAEVKVMRGSELLGNLVGKTKKEGTSPLPEARIMELQAVAELYRQPNPFKVGDIVTPRKNCGLRGHGVPHIVVEVIPPDETQRSWDGNPAGGDYGKVVDIRVLGVAEGPNGDNIIPWWGEHFQYEMFDAAREYETDEDIAKLVDD